jgi:hypothetical protein
MKLLLGLVVGLWIVGWILWWLRREAPEDTVSAAWMREQSYDRRGY